MSSATTVTKPWKIGSCPFVFTRSSPMTRKRRTTINLDTLLLEDRESLLAPKAQHSHDNRLTATPVLFIPHEGRPPMAVRVRPRLARGPISTESRPDRSGTGPEEGPYFFHNELGR